jgi:hypothetical protein
VIWKASCGNVRTLFSGTQNILVGICDLEGKLW